MSAKHKAVGLLSGGLDSILACRMMLDQGLEVIAVNFTSPFCTCTSKGCRHQASKVAEELGIALKIIATGQEYVEMLKHPKHGRGSGMNPCIDCRIFTFTRAREYADEVGAVVVFTGEVLGQRPMSQHLRAMRMIEQESGLTGRLLRPLCAALLEPTEPEKQGIVDRSRLLAIQGRSRKPQMEMAAAYGMTDYPCPAGGCLLTEKEFAARLRDAFAHGEDRVADMKALRIGRHFRLPSGARVIVGRNETENKVLEQLVRDTDIVLQASDFEGPKVVLRGEANDQDRELAARMCARYSDGRQEPEVLVRAGCATLRVAPLPDEDLARLRVGSGDVSSGVRE